VPGHLDPGGELARALGGVVDLDQERAAELTGTAQELVVGLQLVQDVRLPHDALGAHHLLDLGSARSGCFSNRKVRTPATCTLRGALMASALLAQHLAAFLVRDVVEQAGSADRLHGRRR
jgi:hypothetical protein